jgi:hypothetical protein
MVALGVSSGPEQPVSVILPPAPGSDFYRVLADGEDHLREWRLELIGSSVVPVDRQYLHGRSVPVLVTGYEWCLGFQVVARTRHAISYGYRTETYLRPDPIGRDVLSDVSSRAEYLKVHSTERDVVWRLVEPDEGSANEFIMAGELACLSDRILVFNPHKYTRVRGETQIVTVWHPLWDAWIRPKVRTISVDVGGGNPSPGSGVDSYRRSRPPAT